MSDILMDTVPLKDAVLQARDLKLYFPLGKGRVVHAVDGVSFEIRPGRTLGVVGESGSGKSTLARLMVGLYDRDSGSIKVNGRELGADCTVKELRDSVQMVFQDSYSSLNPRLKLFDTLVLTARARGIKGRQARSLAKDLLVKVGLAAERFESSYPSELSGGQRQRVNIARALIGNPEVVILDEAVSALDKSVEAQVLNLLQDLRDELGLTYMFISHDLNVVRYISDDVMVMYLGEVVEVLPADALFYGRTHPYTAVMVASMPSMDPENLTMEAPVDGDPPSPILPPSGCRFHPRCKSCEAICKTSKPKLLPVDETGRHQIACHLFNPGSGHPGATEAGR